MTLVHTAKKVTTCKIKFDMQHDHFQKKKCFDPTPGVEDVCKGKILLVCCHTFYSL